MSEVELSDEKQLLVDEGLLLRLMNETDLGGEAEHKGIHHFLKQIHIMGCSWRSLWNVTLFVGDYEAEVDKGYAEYLDLRASGIEVEWGPDGVLEFHD